MANKEFVEFLNRLWPSEDPEEDERLWQEDFDKRSKEWLEDVDDLEENLEEFAPDQLVDEDEDEG